MPMAKSCSKGTSLNAVMGGLNIDATSGRNIDGQIRSVHLPHTDRHSDSTSDDPSPPVKATSSAPTISRHVRERIVDKVTSSRVTIVIGPTGCGKSTQVPAILLDRMDGRVLCTQPRRLAVVAVSTHVARLRNSPLGGDEVGYHVGQHNVSTRSTKLLFTTAGILLEELRSNGLEALSRFRCVLIDECHERSPESDLCLATIKSFMSLHPHAPIRIVLMSATFHHGRYRSYFSGVPGCEEIDTITLETVESINSFHQRVETLYLEQIMSLLPDGEDHAQLARRIRLHPEKELDGGDGGKTLSFDILELICSLVEWLDHTEPEKAAFLIFAPTYRHLEQCYECLLDVDGGALALSVLHSSVDIEDCLRSMGNGNSYGRRVLLASAIADSSVTIPGVTCVIDLCRALEVRWDLEKKAHVAKTVWASKSVCDQRQGRTGRTCRGRVFRLVDQGFYVSRLEPWDLPQLTLSSCHNEIMSLVTSSNRAMSDPLRLLRKCMDPPPDEVADGSVQHLKSIGACTEGRGKLAPTEYGRLIAALPFNVSDSRIILAGGQLGMLHEALALRAIFSIRPYPILHHFADVDRNDDLLREFYHKASSKDAVSVALANLAAFMYWDAEWNTGRKRLAIRRFQRCTTDNLFLLHPYEADRAFGVHEHELYSDDNTSNERRQPDCGVWNWTPQTERAHTEWCKTHEINPTSVRAIAEAIDVTMKVIFSSNFEPTWISCAHPEPLWRRPPDWRGSHPADKMMIRRVYGERHADRLCHDLTTLCESVESAIGAAKVSGLDDEDSESSFSKMNPPPIACVHHLQGWCSFGERCRNSHSPDAVRPPCRFYRTGTCTKGDGCMFAHSDVGKVAVNANKESVIGQLDAIAPRISSLVLDDGALAWFKSEAKHLLLFGEGKFAFTSSLHMLNSPPCATSTIEAEASFVGAFSRVDATRAHSNTSLQALVGRGKVYCCAWNFPYTGVDEDEEAHESLLLGTFLSLAVLFAPIMGGAQKVHFGLALQGDQFSRWSVLRSARRAGWILSSWGVFDPDSFPGYKPARASGEPFPVENPRFYVFQLMA